MQIKIKLKRPDSQRSVLFVEFFRNGQPFKFYTGKTIQIKNWSRQKQQVLSGEENYQLINKFLDTWLDELKKIISEMEANKVRLNRDVIQNELDRAMKTDSNEAPEKGQIADFVSFMDHYILQVKAQNKSFHKFTLTRKFVLLAFKLAGFLTRRRNRSRKILYLELSH